jgi:hypothetical protein
VAKIFDITKGYPGEGPHNGHASATGRGSSERTKAKVFDSTKVYTGQGRDKKVPPKAVKTKRNLS